MAIKRISFLLISSIFFVGIVHVVSAEETIQDKWIKKIDKKDPKCRSLMSEETQELLEDDENFDNKEVREYFVCGFKALGYLKDRKLQVATIQKDIESFYSGKKETISEDKKIAKFCTGEVPEKGSEREVVAAYRKCFLDKEKSGLGN